MAEPVQQSLPMTETAPRPVVYEQPLSERIRSFLRLEYLFDRATHELGRDDPWASRSTMEALIDIMSLMGRSDVKKEIIKELERHSNTFDTLARNPNVDKQMLEEIMSRIQQFLGALKFRDSPPGYELRYHEFLSSVRQRSSIPAGTCDFDLPNLHYWLKTPAEQRARDLSKWLSAFDMVKEAVSLCLKLVRESSSVSQEVAEGGFYQRSLDSGSPCQMIRVALGGEELCFPEISAGRHRFTVRFMELQNPEERPVQTTRSIQFQLTCCVI